MHGWEEEELGPRDHVRMMLSRRNGWRDGLVGRTNLLYIKKRQLQHSFPLPLPSSSTIIRCTRPVLAISAIGILLKYFEVKLSLWSQLCMIPTSQPRRWKAKLPGCYLVDTSAMLVGHPDERMKGARRVSSSLFLILLAGLTRVVIN